MAKAKKKVSKKVSKPEVSENTEVLEESAPEASEMEYKPVSEETKVDAPVVEEKPSEELSEPQKEQPVHSEPENKVKTPRFDKLNTGMTWQYDAATFTLILIKGDKVNSFFRSDHAIADSNIDNMLLFLHRNKKQG